MKHPSSLGGINYFDGHNSRPESRREQGSLPKGLQTNIEFDLEYCEPMPHICSNGRKSTIQAHLHAQFLGANTFHLRRVNNERGT